MVFELIRIIQALIAFSRETQAFLGEAQRRLDDHDAETAAALRSCSHRILFFAVLYPVVGSLIVPVVVPWIALHLGNFQERTPAVSAMSLGLFLSLLAAFFYLFAGVAVGCLLAPEEFLDSSVGAKWLQLIGTKNHTAARVVCLVLAVVGLLIVFGIAALEVTLMQGPAFHR
jgi:hypothetical protein